MEAYEKFYLFIGFAIPLVAGIIPIFFGLYGYDQYFCWFHTESRVEEFWLKMGFFFIPLWILFILNLVLSQITYQTLRSFNIDQRQLSIFRRLMLFPFIMLFTGAFATADIIYAYVNQDYLIWLDYVGIILLSFYGFFTAIAYGFNPIIREKIEQFFSKSTMPKNASEVKARTNSADDSHLSELTVRGSHTTSNNTEQLQKQLFEIQAMRGTRLLTSKI